MNDIRQFFDAYFQTEINEFYKDKSMRFIANTFEDALLYQNFEFFSAQEGKGVMEGFKEAASKETSKEIVKKAFSTLEKGNKGEFALDLLMQEKFDELKIPTYISEGLDWLEKRLKVRKKVIYIEKEVVEEVSL